jgi:hypothetical protein
VEITVTAPTEEDPEGGESDQSSVVSSGDRVLSAELARDEDMEVFTADTQKYRLPDHGVETAKTIPNVQKTRMELPNHTNSTSVTPGSRDSEPQTPSHSTHSSLATPADFSNEVQSYFNPVGLQRTNSIYSLSRVSFSSQISQLTSLQLPQASSLSSSITAIPTSAAAAKALTGAADQIKRWISKASEVLGGLGADDDIEWAAAGGREGLDDVENAIARFEGLINVYVAAIEELQSRPDISSVPTEELRAVVDQMEKILKEWEQVRGLLKGVKNQVDLAMEWEELWNNVLGDIGQETESLSRLVFEMEEARHNGIAASGGENGTGLDLRELETIVEENPGALAKSRANHRFSLPPAFPQSSPVHSPGPTVGHDDSNLLALFARMQPLRASLDFLPIRLSSFNTRADTIFPTACEELETRRTSLEHQWKTLESDAESLRRELGEDRWVVVFRNAGRQAQKMCESVSRSIMKLKEAIDTGTHHSNPPVLWKKVESYEGKKTHYGPAIERVLSIIAKGVKDRLTINGEILRLNEDMSSRWHQLEQEMKEIDNLLDELNVVKSQQLRDSISSIISMDRSGTASGADTPGSSPASSVVTSSTHLQGDPATPLNNGKIRPTSASYSQQSSRSTPVNSNRRYYSMPPGSVGTSHIPRLTPGSRLSSANHTPMTSRIASPSPGSRPNVTSSARNHRASPSSLDNRPRWNGSVNTKDSPLGHHFKPLSLTTPSPHTRLYHPGSRSSVQSSYSSDTRKPDASERGYSPSPSAATPPASSNRTSHALRRDRNPSQSPARSSMSSVDSSYRPSLRGRPSDTTPSEKRRSGLFEAGAMESALEEVDDSKINTPLKLSPPKRTFSGLPAKPSTIARPTSSMAIAGASTAMKARQTSSGGTATTITSSSKAPVVKGRNGTAAGGKKEPEKPKWR